MQSHVVRCTSENHSLLRLRNSIFDIYLRLILHTIAVLALPQNSLFEYLYRIVLVKYHIFIRETMSMASNDIFWLLGFFKLIITYLNPLSYCLILFLNTKGYQCYIDCNRLYKVYKSKNNLQNLTTPPC